MNVENLVAQRMRALLDQGKNIDDHDSNSRRAWIFAALRVCRLLWQPDEVYVKRFEKLADLSELTPEYQGNVWRCFDEALALAGHVLNDIECGLIHSLMNKARAEVFEDLLDQSEHYLASNKQGASVLSSSVFEDCVRRIARAKVIQEKGIKMDQLLSDLQKNGTLSTVKAKRCRAAADVRNKALHAQWDEFDFDDIRSTISLTRELILEHLDRRF